MSKDQRVGKWASVKVGDELAYTSGWADRHWRKATVERITPSGIMILSNGKRIGRYGRGGDGHSQTQYYVIDDDMRERIEGSILRAHILSLSKKFSDDTLKAADLEQLKSIHNALRMACSLLPRRKEDAAVSD